MSREEWRNRCFNCMAQLQKRDDVCPSCGWDNRNRVNGEGMLEQRVLEGRYLIGRALGRGGFGVTYIGYDLNLKRRVAIKEFFPLTLAYRDTDATTVRPYSGNIDEYRDGLERARNEGQTVVNLGRVPNIVQVYDVLPLLTATETDGTTNGTVYIVMEYINGTTLSKMVKENGRMGWKQALDMLFPIMRALEKVHKQGIIHRDVSPDNIMLDRDTNETTLLDFGAAREASAALTATLRPGFAPIEQYSERTGQDGRVDEYALCATMYYLVTGKAPESADLRAYAKRELKTPRSQGCDIPPKIEAVLLKGMSVDCDSRYESVAALRLAFEEAMQGRGFDIRKGLIIALIVVALGSTGLFYKRMLSHNQQDNSVDIPTATDAINDSGDQPPTQAEVEPDEGVEEEPEAEVTEVPEEEPETEPETGYATLSEGDESDDAQTPTPVPPTPTPVPPTPTPVPPTPTPTPEPFINHYDGGMPSWPTGEDAIVVGLWRQDAYDTPHAAEAFAQAMEAVDISAYGQLVVPTSDDAVSYFMSLIDQQKFSGIVLFPYAGVDYSDCMRAAAQANIAVHVVLEDTPKGIFGDICELYGMNGQALHLDGDVPWPQNDDATILVYYRETDAQNEDVTGAINDAFNMVGYDYEAGHLFSVTPKKGMAVETLVDYLSTGLGEGYPALQAVCVLPYDDVDYSAATEKANEMGIAIHYVEAAQPDDMVNSICKLYGYVTEAD